MREFQANETRLPIVSINREKFRASTKCLLLGIATMNKLTASSFLDPFSIAFFIIATFFKRWGLCRISNGIYSVDSTTNYQ